MSSLSYATIRSASIAKDTEDKRTDNREKAMLLFAFQLLLDKGYIDTASTLASECSLNLEQYTICENIDLNSVFIDFEAYFNMRFQRYPQYFKKLAAGGASASVAENLLAKLTRQKKSGSNGKTPCRRRGLLADGDNSSNSDTCELPCHPGDYQIGIEPTIRSLSHPGASSDKPTSSNEKLLKPISGLEFPNEDMRTFAETLQKEIVVRDLDTKWDDVIGLDSAKMILMESMIYRQQFTEFFGNALPPWRGLLLYGPPGTGKTLLARAVASECGTTFFNISSSSLVSKWRGDSEKIVKVLFDLARYHAPSTIFFDEFDALGSNRDTLGETDASRRLKSELLQQMDGLLSTAQPQLPIFILTATNLPWELDPAIVRRMEKRVFVPLPSVVDRREIFKLHFMKTAQGISDGSNGKNSLVCQLDLDTLAFATDGYSGSDLQQIVKETIVLKFRQHFSDKIRKLTVETQDVLQALQTVSPTVKEKLNDKFTSWDSNYRTN